MPPTSMFVDEKASVLSERLPGVILRRLHVPAANIRRKEKIPGSSKAFGATVERKKDGGKQSDVLIKPNSN